MGRKRMFVVGEGVSGCGKTTFLNGVADSLRGASIKVALNEEPSTHSPFGKAIRETIEGGKLSVELLVRLASRMAEFFREIRERTEDHSPVGKSVVDDFCATVRSAVKTLREGKLPSPREMQALYVVDRYLDLRDYITPHLRDGYAVLNDRFHLSTFAYGAAYGVDMEDIYSWHVYVLGELWHLPDAIVYCKVSAETAARRLFGSGKKIDIWEKREKLQPLIDCYDHAIAFLQRKCVFENLPDVFFTIDGERDQKEVLAEVMDIVHALGVAVSP